MERIMLEVVDSNGYTRFIKSCPCCGSKDIEIVNSGEKLFYALCMKDDCGLSGPEEKSNFRKWNSLQVNSDCSTEDYMDLIEKFHEISCSIKDSNNYIVFGVDEEESEGCSCDTGNCQKETTGSPCDGCTCEPEIELEDLVLDLMDRVEATEKLLNELSEVVVTLSEAVKYACTNCFKTEEEVSYYPCSICYDVMRPTGITFHSCPPQYEYKCTRCGSVNTYTKLI